MNRTHKRKHFKVQTLPTPAHGTPQHRRIHEYDRRKKSGTRPFTKCAGGKLRLVHDFLKLTPDTFSRYIEACVGGGAIFFAMKTIGMLDDVPCLLNDINSELVKSFDDIRQKDPELIRMLKVHSEEYNQHKGHLHYYDIRNAWNSGNRTTDRMLFMRKVAYNGLWRENKKGEMNTPCGNYETCSFDFDNIDRCADVLKEDVELKSLDFRSLDRHIQADDLIYVDPPYDGMFNQYTQHGFDDDDQTELIDLCAKWHSEGAHVVYSNNDTPNVRKWLSDLWPEATAFKVYAYASIAADSRNRRNRSEIMAVGSL